MKLGKWVRDSILHKSSLYPSSLFYYFCRVDRRRAQAWRFVVVCVDRSQRNVCIFLSQKERRAFKTSEPKASFQD